MKIETIEIYGYGKWLQKKFSDLTNLQVFLGNNEAGKSTLSSFIQTMFFGFPSARKKDTNIYIPKQGEAYGGRIFLSGTRFGKVIIERMKDRHRGKAVITYENGHQEVVDHLASYLLGVDRQTYELLYVFKIDRLLDLAKVKKEDLNRYLLGVGTSGSERLLQLAEEYRKEAKKEFLPTGTKPPLNQKIKETENKWLQLQEAKKKNNEYENILVEAATIQTRISDLVEKQQQLERENNDVSEAIRLNDYYHEWLQLEKEIAAVDASHIPKDARKKWDWLQEKISEGIQKQTSLQEQIKNEYKKFEDYSHAQWYRNHQNEWNALQHDFSTVSTQMNQSLFLEEARKEDEAELIILKRTIGLRMDDSIEPFTEEKEAEACLLLEKSHAVQQAMTDVSQNLRTVERKVDALESKISEMEKETVSEEEFRLWETKAKSSNQQSSTKNTKKMNFIIIPLVIFFVAITLITLFPAYRLASALAAGIAALSIVFLFYKQRKVQPADQADTFQMADYIQQATLRERLKELKAEEQQEQDILIQLLNKQEAHEMAWNEEQQRQQNWLIAENYPLSYSLDRVLSEKPAVKISQLEEKITATQQKQQDVEQTLNNWYEQSQFIRDHFGINHLGMKEFIEQFNELHQSVILEDSMSKNTEEKIAELQANLETVQSQLKEHHQKRQELLQNAKVETEAEFYRLLHAKDEQVNQKRRRSFLEEQLEGKKAIFEKYPDKEKAIKRLNSNQQKLADLQLEMKANQKEEVERNHDIRILEKGGTYSSLLQDYAIAETEMREMIVEWAKKVVAAEWLEETLRYGKDNRFPALLEDMSAYFHTLTKQNYSRIVFQKSGIKIQHQNGTVYEPFELSQGTIEQLYIAMRFAFIKNTADIANLPIIIDDGFVNFDGNRKEVMYQLMQELSSSVQIFFFTFDESVKEIVHEEQINMLN